MDKVILWSIGIFFVLGGIDYILGNKLGIGEKFEEGIKAMGILALSMTGIFSISPLIGKVIGKVLVPLGNTLNIDASIFPAMFLACDMGALGMCRTLATNNAIGELNGAIIASTLGATVSFSIPLAMGMIKREHQEDFSKGILCGVVTIPLAGLVGGIMLKIDLVTLLLNLLPVIIVSILLIIGIFKAKDSIVRVFEYIGKGIIIISILGLIIQGFSSIVGIKIEGDIIPIGDALSVVGKISLVLAGAYPMLEIINKCFKKSLGTIGKKLGVNDYGVSSFLGSLASNILVFANYDKMNSKGRILNTAFSVSGAFVFGGQMGFIAAQAPGVLNIYIASKLIAGIAAMVLANFFVERIL